MNKGITNKPIEKIEISLLKIEKLRNILNEFKLNLLGLNMNYDELEESKK